MDKIGTIVVCQCLYTVASASVSDVHISRSAFLLSLKLLEHYNLPVHVYDHCAPDHGPLATVYFASSCLHLTGRGRCTSGHSKVWRHARDHTRTFHTSCTSSRSSV